MRLAEFGYLVCAACFGMTVGSLALERPATAAVLALSFAGHALLLRASLIRVMQQKTKWVLENRGGGCPRECDGAHKG